MAGKLYSFVTVPPVGLYSLMFIETPKSGVSEKKITFGGKTPLVLPLVLVPLVFVPLVLVPFVFVPVVPEVPPPPPPPPQPITSAASAAIKITATSCVRDEGLSERGGIVFVPGYL